MPVDDIRVKLSFKGSRKRYRLRRQAGDAAVIALIDLWIETASQFPLGVLYDCTVEDVEHMAGWTGERGLFVNAMIDAGFLVRLADEEWEMNDWQEHQRWVVHAPERSEAARIAATVRWEALHKPKSKRSPCAPHAESNAPSPIPTPMPSPNPAPTPKGEKPRSRFAPPEAREVREYMSGRGTPINADQFIDFYTSNGWKVGGRAPMKDWQAAARNWYVRDCERKGISSKPRKVSQTKVIRFVVRFSDGRAPETYTAADEAQLAETVVAMGLEPILDGDGEQVVAHGQREYALDVTGARDLTGVEPGEEE